jgi:hypothetical protein
VKFIGGNLRIPGDEGSVVRNLTTTSYGVKVPAGQKKTLPFSFMTEMHPQDLKLSLVSILSNSKDQYFTIPAFDGIVSVVEAETSVFDPQM